MARGIDLLVELGEQPGVGEAEHVGPAVAAVRAPAVLRRLTGDRERLGVLREQPGRVDADEVEPARELALEPRREGRRPVVEPAGQRLRVEPDLVASTRAHTLEVHASSGRHRVDGLTERVQPSHVDEHAHGEPAECQVERLPPRFELGAHLDQLADERQVVRRQPGGLGQGRASRVQVGRDVPLARRDRLAFGAQRGQFRVGVPFLAHRVGEPGLSGSPCFRVGEGPMRRLDQRGEFCAGRHRDAEGAECPVQLLPGSLDVAQPLLDAAPLSECGVQAVTTGGAECVGGPFALRFGGFDQGVGLRQFLFGPPVSLSEVPLGRTEKVEPTFVTPQRGRRRRLGERADRLDQVQPLHRVVDGAPVLADRRQRLHLLASDDHPLARAGQLVELLHHRVRCGQGGRFFEHHRLVQGVDGGDLLAGLDPTEQRDGLVPVTRSADAERVVESRGEVPVGLEARQAGRFDLRAGEPLGRRAFQLPQRVVVVAGGAHRHDVVEGAGGRRHIPGAERGELGTGVVDPGHRDGRPGVPAVTAQHARLRLAVRAGLVELAARVGEDVALVLASGPADHAAVRRAVERGRVRHEQRDVGVHQRRLARPGTATEQRGAGREPHAVIPVVAAPVNQLQVPGHPLLAP